MCATYKQLSSDCDKVRAQVRGFSEPGRKSDKFMTDFQKKCSLGLVTDCGPGGLRVARMEISRRWRDAPPAVSELFDVAALNTTHHFNYLFGHKTVEVQAGLGWARFGSGASGKVSAQFSLAGGWLFEIVKFNKLPAIFIALQAHNARSCLLPWSVRPGALPIDCFPHTAANRRTGKFIYDQRPRDTVFLV